MAKDKIAKAFLAITKDKFTIDTIAEMIATKHLAEGDIVRLNGYYSAGDGANHIRKISKTDDGSGVQLANGLWANLVHRGEVNVSWFGIVKNNEDYEEVNSRTLEKILNSDIIPIFDFGNYYISNLEINKPSVFMKGKSREVYTDRSHTNIFTQGKNFIKTNLSKSCTYNVRGIRFVSLNYTGSCFESPTDGGCSADFRDVFFEGFEKAFYSHSYADSCRLLNVSARKCIYGFYSNLASNNTIAKQVDLLSCVYGYSLAGLNSIVEDLHTGGAISDEIMNKYEYGYLVKSNSVKRMYVEKYGQIGSLNKMYILAIPSILSEVGYSYLYEDIAFPSAGDYAEANHILFTSKTAVNNSVSNCTITLRNCKDIPTKIHTLPQFNAIPDIISEEYINKSNPLRYGLEVFFPLNSTFDNGNLKINPSNFTQTMLNILTTDTNYSVYNQTDKVLRVQKEGWYSLKVDIFSSNLTKDFLFSVKNRIKSGAEKWINKNVSLKAGEKTTFDIDFYHYGFLNLDMNTNLTPTELAGLEITITLRRIGDSKVRSVLKNTLEVLNNINHIKSMEERGILDSYNNYLAELYKYEKQQNTQSDTGVMNLNVIQPPIIPMEVEKYAKEYNLI